MATVRILFCIICLVAIGWCGMSGSDMLRSSPLGLRKEPLKEVFPFEEALQRGEGLKGKPFGTGTTPIDAGRYSPLRYWLGEKRYSRHLELSKADVNAARANAGRRLVELAQGELWVREATGNNDGARVEGYLASVGLKKGQPWCAAFVSFVFKQAGYVAPRTGWSPSLFPVARLVKAAAPGNVFGIYFPALKRIAHCGFVARQDGDWISSIEGNTGTGGGRDGDGVHRRKRHKRTVNRYADWR